MKSTRKTKYKNTSYENRYKYKLNMLEPGLAMMKAIGALVAIGILFWAAGWHFLSVTALLMASAVLIVLLILVAIETHQDKVLNKIAAQENKKTDSIPNTIIDTIKISSDERKDSHEPRL